MLHTIKITREYYNDVLSGRKKFELRRDDRGYQVGDDVILEEWDSEEEVHTGRWFGIKISYVLRNVPEYGLMERYCIFGWR